MACSLVVYTPTKQKARCGNCVIIRNLDYDACITCCLEEKEEFIRQLETSNITSATFFDLDFKSMNLTDVAFPYSNIILKIDHNGDEWEILDALSTETLSKFRQMAIKFHGLVDDSWGVNSEMKTNVLMKLAKTHIPVHVHADNNYAMGRFGEINVPYVLEVTYLRKGEDIVRINKTPFPWSGLDSPNSWSHPEIHITKWPFVYPTMNAQHTHRT